MLSSVLDNTQFYPPNRRPNRIVPVRLGLLLLPEHNHPGSATGTGTCPPARMMEPSHLS